MEAIITFAFVSFFLLIGVLCWWFMFMLPFWGAKEISHTTRVVRQNAAYRPEPQAPVYQQPQLTWPPPYATSAHYGDAPVPAPYNVPQPNPPAPEANIFEQARQAAARYPNPARFADQFVEDVKRRRGL